mmetsp:Transcript_20719/g.57323  ORF Transcript_20719/g.57323 Transcript_20719/m.57323 type:complete len:246 (-) Transcript_20719:1277-2014(-)
MESERRAPRKLAVASGKRSFGVAASSAVPAGRGEIGACSARKSAVVAFGRKAPGRGGPLSCGRDAPAPKSRSGCNVAWDCEMLLTEEDRTVCVLGVMRSSVFSSCKDRSHGIVERAGPLSAGNGRSPIAGAGAGNGSSLGTVGMGSENSEVASSCVAPEASGGASDSPGHSAADTVEQPESSGAVCLPMASSAAASAALSAALARSAGDSAAAAADVEASIVAAAAAAARSTAAAFLAAFSARCA